MPTLNIDIPLQPKQVELYNLVHHSPATWIGYGGSRGGAKSHAARSVVLLMLLENPGTRACLLRRTYDLVRENHVEPLLTQYPFMREWYRVGDKELIIPNGSVLAFRYAENQGDVEAMIGKQYRWFCVDQAEAFTAKELNTMKSCTRWPGVDGAGCKFVLTFNPGNVGHAELKRIFVDKQYRCSNGEIYNLKEFIAKQTEIPDLEFLENPSDYAFLQAYGWDNIEWSREALRDDGASERDYYQWDTDKRFEYFIKRTQYGRELNALPQAMRIGWLLGNMDEFAGQYFDIFSPERHIKSCQPNEWHTRWIGIDWGFAHLSGCYWASQIADKLTAFYREFCESGRSPKALAQEIVDRTPVSERPQVKHIYLSFDAFAKRTESDTIADQMAEVFRANNLPWPEQASKDPKGRATLLYDMMGPIDANTGEFRTPEVVIDPSCRQLIRTIPMVCRDKNDQEKPLKFEGDDPFEGATHALTYRMKNTKIPGEVLAMEAFEKISDPVAKWFAIAAYKRKNKPRSAIINPRVVMPWEAGRR